MLSRERVPDDHALFTAKNGNGRVCHNRDEAWSIAWVGSGWIAADGVHETRIDNPFG